MAASTATPTRRARKTAAPTPVPAAVALPEPTLPVVVLNASQIVALEELKTLRAHQRVLKARDEQLTEELKSVLRNSGGGVNEENVLLASVSPRAGRRSVDYGRLALKHPEAYEDTVSVGNPSDVLTIHKH